MQFKMFFAEYVLEYIECCTNCILLSPYVVIIFEVTLTFYETTNTEVKKGKKRETSKMLKLWCTVEMEIETFQRNKPT